MFKYVTTLFGQYPNIDQINYNFLEVVRHTPVSEMFNVKENARRTDENVTHTNTWNTVWQIAYVYWMLAIIIYIV